MVEINDIYRIESSNYESGIYRVVGTSNNIVLVKIGDLNKNRIHTGHIIKTTEDKLQDFDNSDIPKKNIKQKIISKINMIPYILSANYDRMKDNNYLNIVSLIFLVCGLLFDFLVIEYPIISSTLILIGSLGFALSMSVFYN